LNRELTGTIKAILDEYKKAINELIFVIQQLRSSEITRIMDNETTNPDCRSIQTILTHIIHSGYGYTNYIENHPDHKKERPLKEYFENSHQYIEHLKKMFEYCETFFIKNPFIRLEETDNSKKMTTSWGQQYDIDQLMEHAIVHVLKHRRQIENFIKIQKTDI